MLIFLIVIGCLPAAAGLVYLTLKLLDWYVLLLVHQ